MPPNRSGLTQDHPCAVALAPQPKCWAGISGPPSLLLSASENIIHSTQPQQVRISLAASFDKIFSLSLSNWREDHYMTSLIGITMQSCYKLSKRHTKLAVESAAIPGLRRLVWVLLPWRCLRRGYLIPTSRSRW
jgi:hypothetical protein